jgi:hypothetical protein
VSRSHIMIVVIGGALLIAGPAFAVRPIGAHAQGSVAAGHTQDRRLVRYRRFDRVGGWTKAVVSAGDLAPAGHGRGRHSTKLRYRHIWKSRAPYDPSE